MTKIRTTDIFTHFGLSTFLILLIFGLTTLVGEVFPDIGWGLITLAFILIGIGQILFYYMTSYHSVGLTILSFILNFVIWVAEQVNLEKAFSDTFFYKDKDLHVLVLLLGAFLWTLNKLVIDKIFDLFKFNRHHKNRLIDVLTRARTANSALPASPDRTSRDAPPV